MIKSKKFKTANQMCIKVNLNQELKISDKPNSKKNL